MLLERCGVCYAKQVIVFWLVDELSNGADFKVSEDYQLREGLFFIVNPLSNISINLGNLLGSKTCCDWALTHHLIVLDGVGCGKKLVFESIFFKIAKDEEFHSGEEFDITSCHKLLDALPLGFH